MGNGLVVGVRFASHLSGVRHRWDRTSGAGGGADESESAGGDWLNPDPCSMVLLYGSIVFLHAERERCVSRRAKRAIPRAKRVALLFARAACLLSAE